MAAMGQDLMICQLCEKSPVQMYCNKCDTSLCIGCVGEHIANDSSVLHDVVIYKKKNEDPIFPDCKTHTKQRCERHCRECDIPLCARCIASGSHEKHEVTELFVLYAAQKDILEKKSKELQTSIYPDCEKHIKETEDKIAKLPGYYQNLTTSISKQGEEWHREIDIIVDRNKRDVEKMQTKDLENLTKHLSELKTLLSAIRQTILDINYLLKYNNVSNIIHHKFSSSEIKLPEHFNFNLPTFTAPPVQKQQLSNMFGTLMSSSVSESQSLQPIDDIATDHPIQQLSYSQALHPIDTGYESRGNAFLGGISCFSQEKLWVYGQGKDMKCFNNKGSLQQTVNTITGHSPSGITVTRQGELVYTNINDRSVNIARRGRIEKMISITTPEWNPGKVSFTRSGDLLVGMWRRGEHSRVVRYCGSVEKQVIQNDDQGKPFFSSTSLLFMKENGNGDLCFSDYEVKAVVVLNQAGNLLRFRYTGNLSLKKYTSFDPHGITTDSLCQILVADHDNNCVHIINQNGNFIRYINSCGLEAPYDLSLDEDGNLYVAEFDTCKVKIIKCLEIK